MTSDQIKAAGFIAKAEGLAKGLTKGVKQGLKRRKPAAVPPESHASALAGMQIDVGKLHEQNLSLIKQLGLDPSPHTDLTHLVQAQPEVARSGVIELNALLIAIGDAEMNVKGPGAFNIPGYEPDYVKEARVAWEEARKTGGPGWEKPARVFTATSQHYYDSTT